MSRITLAIHGGAGTILQSMMTPELEAQYTIGLQQALDRGYLLLEKGESALEAVEAAVIELEDNILFNAGRGAVFTNQGLHEMDASIMDGMTLEAGAVAGVKNIKNPIQLCREIMLHSGHVYLSGEGANEFARTRGFELLPDDYFYSDYRYNQWTEIRDSDTYQLDHKKENNPTILDKKFGTVGAVACDSRGNIAAATSTGGMTNKRFGRVGDSPLIGAGTYANNATCAVSCTGHGEYFIRAVVAYDISCLIEYRGYTLEQACAEVVKNKLVKMGGEGGIIAVDTLGNYELCFNSEGMYRGVKNNSGLNSVAIYGDSK